MDAAMLTNIFPGNSDMAKKMRAFDWINTELGNPEQWCDALKTSIVIMLTSHFPMFIWWGNRFINLYNDACVNFFPNHIDTLGTSARLFWPETCHDLTHQFAFSDESRHRGNIKVNLTKFSYTTMLTNNNEFAGIVCQPIRTAATSAETQQLQCISSRMIEENNIEALCEQILDVAMVIMNSDFSSIQIYNPESNELSLLAWRNFHPDSANYWKKVSTKTSTTCGVALQHGQRIIVSDINTAEFMQNTDSLYYFRLSGINAVQSTPLTTREGRVLGMISTHWRECYEPNEYELALFDVLVRQMSDVLERQRTQEALKEAAQRKDEFLAVLAHELRNPLFPVKNALYLLQQNTNHAINIDLIHMVERQVDHMIRLVDDLLEISRITTGKIELRKETISLINVINNAIEASKPFLDSKQHQLMLSACSETFFIHADMVRMTQVFANLLNNAAKYTHENGMICVNIVKNGNHIDISIKDNGIGIASALLPRVFELFSQGKHEMDPLNRGLGIGLAMVESLTKLHGGSVVALSAGHLLGSEFIVSLPLIENKMNEKKIKATHIKNNVLVDLRILIVDDNADIRESLAMVLESWKVQVKTASDGRSALILLDDFHPHAVFLDIGMPEMDGYEVAKQIRQHRQYDAVKLVALTGWNQSKDHVQSKAVGFDEHFGKPIDFSVLYKLLNSFLAV